MAKSTRSEMITCLTEIKVNQVKEMALPHRRSEAQITIAAADFF